VSPTTDHPTIVFADRHHEELEMQIHWRNPNAIEEALRDRAEERIEALGEDHTDLIDVWIDVHVNTHHRQGADEVSLRAQVRGAEIVVRRQAEEAGLALRDALEAFEREMHKLRGRRGDRSRGAAAPNMPPHLGIVDRVFPDRGYGFILTDSGDEVYFHRNAVQHELRFETLQEGQRVALNFEPGEKGLQATVVQPPAPDAPRV
jgi:cold shock CspA family protein/ribosome-associated translation inhibitor RaiA